MPAVLVSKVIEFDVYGHHLSEFVCDECLERVLIEVTWVEFELEVGGLVWRSRLVLAVVWGYSFSSGAHQVGIFEVLYGSQRIFFFLQYQMGFLQ